MTTPFKQAEDKIAKEKEDLLKRKEEVLVDQIVAKIKEIDKLKEKLLKAQDELEVLKKTKVSDVVLPADGCCVAPKKGCTTLFSGTSVSSGRGTYYTVSSSSTTGCKF